jgi:hypothetical protein
MGYEQALELQATLARRLTAETELLEFQELQRQDMFDKVMASELFDDPDVRKRTLEYSRIRLSAGLEKGSPYYWSPDMSAMLAVVASTMPDWTLRPESLPSEQGFIYFATPLSTPRPDGLNQRLRAISYEPSSWNGIAATFWGETGRGIYPVHATMWEFEQPVSDKKLLYDEETPHLPHLMQYTRYMAAAFALMEQTIVVKQVERAPRSTRKRLGDIGETPIRVVKLRRVERHEMGRDGGKAYELTCQFVVSGHWKQVVYGPKGSLRRPQLILPHIKGPEGAPMKINAERVFVVDR